MAFIIKYIMRGSIPSEVILEQVFASVVPSKVHEQLSSLLNNRKKRFCCGELPKKLPPVKSIILRMVSDRELAQLQMASVPALFFILQYRSSFISMMGKTSDIP